MTLAQVGWGIDDYSNPLQWVVECRGICEGYPGTGILVTALDQNGRPGAPRTRLPPRGALHPETGLPWFGGAKRKTLGPPPINQGQRRRTYPLHRVTLPIVVDCPGCGTSWIVRAPDEDEIGRAIAAHKRVAPAVKEWLERGRHTG